ncbi:Ectonucleoside triphosphate diphosphohydrolase 8 [Orchesella cincta]|uniref:Ectonucleoside triphosphate diphosphohydrolase 8 n=1 Tax=Orchesella cincta TaxID=48709 RepID=A0A1D2MZF3_ORCCI|nr:Ectonucleoside triphosphate diphosphohydrolase 8 [Orchesella cincta]
MASIVFVAQYAMVIDAGSTHTDMILYSWPGSKRNNTGEVTQIHLCSATGGIAQVALENISVYFKPCFDESYAFIKDESRKNAEVLFGATAGMRLLEQTDPIKASEVISGVKSYFRQSDWQFKELNVGIIAGSTEGVSGWITTNFLLQTVLKKGSVDDTSGAMDLGGASTQISFEVSQDSVKDFGNVYPITLFGNRYYIFSQSFICHGVVQSLMRYRAALVIEQSSPEGETIDIKSPCEPLGGNFNASAPYFSSVCVKADIVKGNKTYNFVGTGNYPECQRIISKLLNYTECSNAKLGYCVDPAQIPDEAVRRRFYAFAAYSYITTDLQIPIISVRTEAQRQIKGMCEKTKAQLVDVKAVSKNKKRKYETLCFEGQYMFTLLSELYGFKTDEDWTHISFTNQVRNTTLGWSLGYMVNATEEIAAAPPIPKLKVLPFSMLIVLFVIFVLLSIAFSIHGYKVKKNATGYQRLPP